MAYGMCPRTAIWPKPAPPQAPAATAPEPFAVAADTGERTLLGRLKSALRPN